MLSEEVDFFMNNGYVVIKNAVDQTYCESVISASNTILNNTYGPNYSQKIEHVKVTPYNNDMSPESLKELNGGYSFNA